LPVIDELSIKDNGEPEPEGQGAEPLAQVKVIPWITYAVIAICGVIFALGLDKESLFYIRLSRILVPRGAAIWKGAYWGLLTSALVHGAFWHILFNMWWLKDFGALLEPTMGRVKYLLFIIAAAIVSSGAELALTNDTGIGFSGVVYAMFGYALAARHIKPLYQQLVTKQTIVWLLGWLVLCIILTVTGVWNIANGSHIAGFFFGYCIGNAFIARAYVTLSRLGLVLLIVLTVLSATYMPWSELWLFSSGNYLAGIKTFSKAIEQNPNEPSGYYNRGFCYFKLKDYQQAIKDLDKAIELDPKEPDAYGLRGAASAKLGNHEQALKDYNKAIELNPKLAETYYNRGVIYDKKQQRDRAIEDYNKAIELNPKSDDAYNNRGNAYLNKLQYDKAIEDYNKAIELNQRYDKAYNNRGIAYGYKQQYDRAIKDYNKAIELNPKDASAYYNVARVYSITNKTEEACKLLKQSIENGFNEWKHIQSDKGLDNIRDSSCYKEIMSKR
jgi:tetratricopeptide (TPR) repeat protein/membrane associated rhomboid family serine protease